MRNTKAFVSRSSREMQDQYRFDRQHRLTALGTRLEAEALATMAVTVVQNATFGILSRSLSSEEHSRRITARWSFSPNLIRRLEGRLISPDSHFHLHRPVSRSSLAKNIHLRARQGEKGELLIAPRSFSPAGTGSSIFWRLRLTGSSSGRRRRRLRVFRGVQETGVSKPQRHQVHQWKGYIAN